MSGATSLMTMVLHNSRKCSRWPFVSLPGKPQNGFAYTIMISLGLSSKFSLPVLTVGPTGTLATVGMEYSWSDFWAISVVADGEGTTGSFVSGVAQEETT